MTLDYALPSKRIFPIMNLNHLRAAIARFVQFNERYKDRYTPEEMETIRKNLLRKAEEFGISPLAYLGHKPKEVFIFR